DAIWYTDFARGYLGRLDPKTGKVSEWQSPSGPKSEPYGIVFTKGALWYSESFAKPCTVVRFDPKTEKFQTWLIPGPLSGDIVRNRDVRPDGSPVLANSLANEVALVEIKSDGHCPAYPSPAGGGWPRAPARGRVGSRCRHPIRTEWKNF